MRACVRVRALLGGPPERHTLANDSGGGGFTINSRQKGREETFTSPA